MLLLGACIEFVGWVYMVSRVTSWAPHLGRRENGMCEKVCSNIILYRRRFRNMQNIILLPIIIFYNVCITHVLSYLYRRAALSVEANPYCKVCIGFYPTTYSWRFRLLTHLYCVFNREPRKLQWKKFLKRLIRIYLHLMKMIYGKRNSNPTLHSPFYLLIYQY